MPRLGNRSKYITKIMPMLWASYIATLHPRVYVAYCLASAPGFPINPQSLPTHRPTPTGSYLIEMWQNDRDDRDDRVVNVRQPLFCVPGYVYQRPMFVGGLSGSKSACVLTQSSSSSSSTTTSSSSSSSSSFVVVVVVTYWRRLRELNARLPLPFKRKIKENRRNGRKESEA